MSDLLNIGHRGHSSRYPENTLRAFQMALQSGAQGFECDLRLSKDGEIYVFHDEDFIRLCGVSGSIESSGEEFISRLRVNGKEQIPRLIEVLEGFPEARINLEIKDSAQAPVLVGKLMGLLEKNYSSRRFLVSSFSIDLLVQCKGLRSPGSNIELGYIFKKIDESTFATIGSSPWLYSLHPHFGIAKQVQKFSNKVLWIWTPNTAALWSECAKLPNAEALITDKPDKLNQFILAKRKKGR